MTRAALVSLLLAAGAFAIYTSPTDSFTFVILGDRTGSAVPGVYEQAWRETDADHPSFVLNVGDTIEGYHDGAIDVEWRRVMRQIQPFRRYKIFFTPGNHDVWSQASAQAFQKYTSCALHYSFDFKQAHFTVLDNSRTDQLSDSELAYLEKDLSTHATQRIKFVVSHRPSWILNTVLRNRGFRLQQMAERYGVRYVIAGHIHEMLRFDLNGVTYLSFASSGGHLRGNKQYESGWFFQHTFVTVHGDSVNFDIKELPPPFGRSRVSHPADWGAAGLVSAASMPRRAAPRLIPAPDRDPK
ncbi:MAG: metallophosphoesterase [Acidobacteriaceae bacterium]|nr:metallophosphoesterase [Acidobacteriaceae bacterium]